jgi:hypothetical protein
MQHPERVTRNILPVPFAYPLDSRFFREETSECLVYASPFAVPLAYTGSACC